MKTPSVVKILLFLSTWIIIPAYFVPHAISQVVLAGVIMGIISMFLIIYKRCSKLGLIVAVLVTGILSTILIDAIIEKRKNAFWIAIVKCDIPEIKHLISKGENVNQKSDIYGWTTFTAAYRYGYGRGMFIHPEAKRKTKKEKERIIQKTLKFLLDNGANINVADDQNYSPLHRSIFRNQINIVRMLIIRKADVNQKGGILEKRTPLKIALDSGYEEIVDLLRENGAKE